VCNFVPCKYQYQDRLTVLNARLVRDRTPHHHHHPTAPLQAGHRPLAGADESTHHALVTVLLSTQDASGELDAAEIRALFLKASPALDNSPELVKMCEQVVSRLDLDQNRRISWEEFKSVFKIYQLLWIDVLFR